MEDDRRRSPRVAIRDDPVRGRDETDPPRATFVPSRSASSHFVAAFPMPSVSTRVPATLAALLLLGWLLSPDGTAPPSAANLSRIRAQSIEVRALIDSTLAHSPTARALVARLAATDAIVYVEVTASPQIPTARTKLVTSVERARFMRISINMAMSQRERGGLLAHELQHALEIAEHAEVRDDNDVRRLYRRIGHAAGGDSFETDAARAVEWTVRAELRTKMSG